MKYIYTTSLALLTFLASFSQYTQNFDTLVNTGTSLYTLTHEGWGIYEIGAGAAADGKYAVGNGSSNTGNAYSFGSTGSTDRALGTLASSNNFPSLGVIFFNEIDSALTTITITYTGEQWRYGGRTAGTHDSLKFEYSLDAQGIVNNQGTWVHVSQLDFLSRITSTPTNAGVALDGNAAANRQTLSYTITGLNIQPGESIVLRWSDFDIASTDDGLGIDDFSISRGLSPGAMTSGGTTVGGGTGGGGGTNTGTSTSVPIFQPKVAIDSGFLHLYGNLHGHSTHSDGFASTLQPQDDYAYARTAQGMDFLGISEHNHSQAGLHIADYKIGDAQANAANGVLNNAGNPFIALHGMEWGTISGGGHVLVYGFKDSVIGWEPGNYDIFVQKSDYMSLFDIVRKQPGAVAMLAHPKSSDFTGLTGGYKGVADSGVVSVAIESGPYNTTSTSYNDFPSSLAFINYYRNLLKQGYRVGAEMDQDNHEMTFGAANGNRMVVLSRDRTREGLMDGIRGMRIYATNDYNAQVNFTIGGYVLGSSIFTASDMTGMITYSDGNGEALSTVQVYGGKVRGSDAALIHTASGPTTFTVTQGDGESWYYYVVLTQADGNKIVTSPIWVTRAAGSPLPVTLTEFKGSYSSGVTTLSWKTATELNNDHFVVERSTDLRNFTDLQKVMAKGSNSTYSLVDLSPAEGSNYYRLRQVDKDGKITYSSIVTVVVKNTFVTLSPNPTKGLLTVKRSGSVSDNVLVQIVDAAGNRIYYKEHTGTQFTLDLSTKPSGYYAIRIGDEVLPLLLQK